jgi:hypothetical protein
MLSFDPIEHRYEWNGKRVPSVTEVLSWWEPRRKCGRLPLDRGQAVHLAILYWIQGDLDERSIPPLAVPYFDAFRRFMSDTGFKPDLTRCERPMYCAKLGIAGTPDLVGKLFRCNSRIDVKTGSMGRADLQTALYSMFPGFTLARLKRFGLLLKENGFYNLVPFTNATDYAEALDIVRRFKEAA